LNNLAPEANRTRVKGKTVDDDTLLLGGYRREKAEVDG